MGIKNLLKFLYNFKDVVKIKQKTDFFNKRIAIDISILLYQSVINIRNTGRDITNKNNIVISHIIGLLNKILSLLDNGIIPIFVFDGKPPDIKKKLLTLRREVKNRAMIKYENTNDTMDKIKFFKRCVSITKEQMDDCRELLTMMGLPYIDAPEEADSVLAYLCKNNIVDAVLTEDMDILTFGAPKIIRNVLSFDKPLIEINLKDILTNLNITYIEFVDLCIYFGCDYCTFNNNIASGLTNIEIYDLYKKNNNELNRIVGIDNDEFKSAKKYFITDLELNINKNLDLQYPDIIKLTELLKTKYDFSISKIKYKVNKLVYYYNRSVRYNHY
jgi:flap endonuclease-1